MNKAYVDTTILTDALLKPGLSGKTAKAALRRFEVTELPVYAIKEFKAGPLKNFKWMHNKLVSLRSFTKALNALQRMSLTPKRYTTATALEALTGASSSIGQQTPSDLVAKYGSEATLDSIQCDEYRLAIKVAIFKAWTRRKRLTTHVIQPLACYDEVSPFEERGLIVIEPTSCKANPECCLAKDLKRHPETLRKLEAAVKLQPTNRERVRRYQALHDLVRKPKQPMTEDTCRNLGDAIFAFFAPEDAVILTTNVRDHRDLAEAVGKKVESP